SRRLQSAGQGCAPSIKFRTRASSSAIDGVVQSMEPPMPSRARLDEFIAAVVSGDHAGAIERFYTEDASMQENAAAPRVGRDLLVAHERAVLERVESVTSICVASVVEGDRVAINWVFEFVYKSGKTGRFDEVALQEWRGDRVFRERFFYDPSKPAD